MSIHSYPPQFRENKVNVYNHMINFQRDILTLDSQKETLATTKG